MLFRRPSFTASPRPPKIAASSSPRASTTSECASRKKRFSPRLVRKNKMSSLLWYGDQGCWVSNGTKWLLYEIVLEMARRADPEAHKKLQDEERLVGCYGVSGMGFELEAFEECLAGKDHFRNVVAEHFDVVRELCD